MSWPSLQLYGSTFTFDHLQTFDIEVIKPAKGDFPELRYIVRIVFHSHVFTEDCPNPGTGPEFLVDESGRPRVFDLARYKGSLKLPALISALVDGKTFCHEAKYGNYLYWDPPPGVDVPPFLFFFNLVVSSRDPNLIVMNVQSAYIKEQPQGINKDNRKIFARICAELLGVVAKKTKGPRSKGS